MDLSRFEALKIGRHSRNVVVSKIVFEDNTLILSDIACLEMFSCKSWAHFTPFTLVNGQECGHFSVNSAKSHTIAILTPSCNEIEVGLGMNKGF